MGNFVITASDPGGDWSEPHWLDEAEGIDPSLFFDDDDKCWYVGNGAPEKPIYEGHRNLWLQQFDYVDMKLIGEKIIIVDGGVDITKEPIWIEGPHIYKINGKYILIAAEGGTAENHSVVVFKSASVTGPYIPYGNNPILTNKDLPSDRQSPITCTGHADLVETQNGEWWIVLLACRPFSAKESGLYNLGRETFLCPIKWENSWPETKDGSGILKHSYDNPNLAEYHPTIDYAQGAVYFEDNFASTSLRPEWIYVRNPDASAYSLTEKPGSLSIIPKTSTITSLNSPSIVLLRQRSISFKARVTIDLYSQSKSDIGGICVIQNNLTYIAAQIVNTDGGKVIQCVKQTKLIQDADSDIVQSSIIDGFAPVTIEVSMDGTNNSLTILYSTVNSNWETLCTHDANLLSTGYAGGFVGAMIGLYAVSSKPSNTSIASFRNFWLITSDLA
jgi:alpha-N-arabinofuranosidase